MRKSSNFVFHLNVYGTEGLVTLFSTALVMCVGFGMMKWKLKAIVCAILFSIYNS